MSAQLAEAPTTTGPVPDGQVEPGLDDWDLDVTFVEQGDSVDKLIYMTDDGCGTTCQSACPASCS